MSKTKKGDNREMSEREAERLLEMYENASKNGEEWTHDVLLNRGSEKYHSSIARLNEAFRIKFIATVIQPLKTMDSVKKEPSAIARKQNRKPSLPR
jgi:hypothetical protein